VPPRGGLLQDGQPFARPLMNRPIQMPVQALPPSMQAEQDKKNTTPRVTNTAPVQYGGVMNGGVMIPSSQPNTKALPDNIFLNTNTQQLHSQVGQFESRLYGHAYPNQTLPKRIARMERTLFGDELPGPIQPRFAHLVKRMSEDKGLPSSVDHANTLAYMEQRFYQRTYPNWTVVQRVAQLEEYVFGKANEKLPISDRVKKLTFTVPIQAKEIRVVNKEKQILATTHPQGRPRVLAADSPDLSPEASREYSVAELSPKASSSQIPSSHVSSSPLAMIQSAQKSTTPASQPIQNPAAQNPGLSAPPDYLEALFRLPTSQKALRWTHTPVWVYQQQGSQEELLILQQALQFWGSSTQLKLTSNVDQADVLVDWAGPPPTRLKALTRTASMLDAQKTVRNVVVIDMAFYHEKNYKEKMRGMIHQLGHSYGMWGHSDDPRDVMYPQTAQEAADIPDAWNQGMVQFSSAAPEPMAEEYPVQPSKRDRTTVTQLYKVPAEDLRFYTAP
jgi:hypothetical protein